jgi:integrase
MNTFQPDLIVEVTGACNRACDGCYAPNVVAKDAASIYETRPEIFLKALSLKHALSEISTPVRIASVRGGEPTLHPEIVTLLRIAAIHADQVFLETHGRWLMEDEIRKLLSYGKTYEPAWFPIWAFAAYTGCRNGELYALKWSDIDFQERLITVQRSYNKKFKEEKCTKTGDWRRVSICEPLWEIVLELKRVHDHELERGACKNVGYVLPRPGLWQNGDQARKLRQFCEEIGITPICFHTLRACFATELLKRGVDVPSVMRVGGWKSLKTMMHYVRLSGVGDRGITDPLDYRSEDPKLTNETLMKAVGDSFDADFKEAEIIPIASRRIPSFGK